MIKIAVEDIQKINNLVQELMKKGVCTSREEAVKMAERFLDKQVISSKTQALGPEPKINQNSQNLSSQDIESLRNMLERTKEYLQKDLEKFRAALAVLAKDMDNIKKDIRNLKVAGENRSIRGTDLDGKSVKEAAETQKKIETKNDFHPKQGRYKADDVSVEKVFYFGKK